MELALICILVSSITAAPSGRIVFPDDPSRSERKLEEPLTPPVLPVLPHLENDPSTFRESDKVESRSATTESSELSPRFGINHGFDVSPNDDGGVTATFSNGYSGLGSSQSVAQSFAFGFNKGFQASQSSSSSGSFNNPGFVGSSFSNSQAHSQASSFSAGSNGISASAAAASASSSNGQSAANSQSAGFGANYGGNSLSGSQSGTFTSGNGNAFSNAAGFATSGSNRPGNNYSGHRPGNSYSGSRPSFSGAENAYSNGNNFGVGSIDIRNKPKSVGGVVTSIVFPGDSLRGNTDDDSDEVITFDADRWLGSSSRYQSQGNGGFSKLLSILID